MMQSAIQSPKNLIIRLDKDFRKTEKDFILSFHLTSGY